jgi:hypothetical protein
VATGIIDRTLQPVQCIHARTPAKSRKMIIANDIGP